MTGIVKVLLLSNGRSDRVLHVAAFILGFAVLVVSTKDTVHSVLFLVLDFLFVAALYVLLGAQFLAASRSSSTPAASSCCICSSSCW